MSAFPKVDLVGVGLNAIDTLIPLKHFPARGSKTEYTNASIMPGGQTATAIVACQTWGLETRYIGKVGEDDAGRLHQRRAATLQPKGIQYIDAGTSGGVWGLKVGYCLMVGGDESAVKRLAPAFETLAPPSGWAHVGSHGAGHYVKMVHNGIEYSLMQSYAEGFELMAKSDYRLDLPKISHLWMHGSVVRSWLLDLTSAALAANPEMSGIAPYVVDSGEGRWTVSEAIDLDVPAPVITASLIERLRSRDDDSFTDKLLSAMRNQFGGHDMKKES